MCIVQTENISSEDIVRLKYANVSLKDVEAWKSFYKSMINKVDDHSKLAEKYRMDLMQKIIELW